MGHRVASLCSGWRGGWGIWKQDEDGCSSDELWFFDVGNQLETEVLEPSELASSSILRTHFIF